MGMDWQPEMEGGGQRVGSGEKERSGEGVELLRKDQVSRVPVAVAAGWPRFVSLG